MRAILVNPFDQTIKEAVYAGDYREIYDLMKGIERLSSNLRDIKKILSEVNQFRRGK